LIRWIEERRSRRKLLDEEDLYVRNEEEVNNIFFAYQVIIIKLMVADPDPHRGSALFWEAGFFGSTLERNAGSGTGSALVIIQEF
jgi:hypothetical protein